MERVGKSIIGRHVAAIMFMCESVSKHNARGVSGGLGMTGVHTERVG